MSTETQKGMQGMKKAYNSTADQWCKSDTGFKTCPGCSDPLIEDDGFFFCEREHGTKSPPWIASELPEAIRSSRPGRFVIPGEGEFWVLTQHGDWDIGSRSIDRPGDTIVATVKRQNYTNLTAVILRRSKSRIFAAPRSGPCLAEVSQVELVKRISSHKSRVEKALRNVQTAKKIREGIRPYGFFIKAVLARQLRGVMDASITKPRGGRCLVGDCIRDAFKRGLCRACYGAAKSVTEYYPITWLDIDLLGLASPATLPSGRYYGILGRSLAIGRILGKLPPDVKKPPYQCKIAGCSQNSMRRGLCSSCYSRARKCVKKLKTSWSELESLGLAVPATYGRVEACSHLSQ